MKTTRLLASLTIVLTGVLIWQQFELSRLRRAVRGQAAHTSSDTGPQVARLQAEIAQLRTAAAAVPPDVAAMRDEITALKQANAELTQSQTRVSSGLAMIDLATSGELLTAGVDSAVAPREPETTGLLPDGTPASWSHRQATGPPDTPRAGDVQTAWASRAADGGVEWLQLRYPREVEVAQLNSHETYNPGAVAKVTALMPDGSERLLWEGTEPREEAPVEVGLRVPPGIRSDQIKVYVDTARVPGWNEIDAVEMVGTDGSKQWASESSASSYYGDQRGAGVDQLGLSLESLTTYRIDQSGSGEPTNLVRNTIRGLAAPQPVAK